MNSHTDFAYLRLTLGLIGALAGFCAYGLIEYAPRLIDDQRIVFFLAALCFGFFTLLLTLTGPLKLRSAGQWSLLVSGVFSSLLFWAGFRFETISGFSEDFPAFVAFLVGIFLSLVFISARFAENKGWLNYEALFDWAWNLKIRLLTSFLFLGLFWALLYLSSLLLQQVGFDLLENLIDQLWFGFSVSGLILGLALAVMFELQGVITTLRQLFLGLYRLLVPLVAVVTAIFLALVPFRGVEELFGHWSFASLILAMVCCVITFVTSAVGAKDTEATANIFTTWGSRLLAVLLPVLTGMAAYSLWVRVGQYGWTPNRVAGAVVVFITMSYALVYAGSVILAWRHWMAGIRIGNIVAALVALSVCILWLSPALNAQKISTNSQINRYQAKNIPADNLGLWELQHEWGVAGKQGVARLREIATDPQEAALADRLAVLGSANSSWEMETGAGAGDPRESAELLAELVPVAGNSSEKLTALERQGIPVFERQQLVNSCRALIENKPGCIAIRAEFLPSSAGDEVMLVWRVSHGEGGGTSKANTQTGPLRAAVLVLEKPDAPASYQPIWYPSDHSVDPAQVLQNLHAGQYAIAPVGINQLIIGEFRLVPPLQ